MTTGVHQAQKGHRTLRLPIAEHDYESFVSEKTFAKERLDQLYGQYPELFPESFAQGYALYGFTAWSRKLDRRWRRLRLVATEVVYTVAPGFVRPYMTGYTGEVAQALFLRRFHVPCWAMAHVFGRDAMSWYRLEQRLGRLSVVGTTVKDAAQLPKDLVADEKHRWLRGERVSIATTAGQGCLLGASVAAAASQANVTKAYGECAKEARDVDPTDAPASVTTDGWPATPGAWQALFPRSCGILCFRQAFLKRRARAPKALAGPCKQVGENIWPAYEAPTKRGFAQRVRRLKEWAKTA